MASSCGMGSIDAARSCGSNGGCLFIIWAYRIWHDAFSQRNEDDHPKRTTRTSIVLLSGYPTKLEILLPYHPKAITMKMTKWHLEISWPVSLTHHVQEKNTDI
eukprot:scaffold421245_cov61-Attheya_sp.AAC.3